MLTLSYGFQKPENGDNSTIWFPALANNAQKLNDHTHNGTNSSLLTAQSITGISDQILAASWVATSGGTYRQSVTMPAATDYDNYGKSFMITSSGHEINPTVEKIDDTHYYVYINDNSLTLTVLYLV